MNGKSNRDEPYSVLDKIGNGKIFSRSTLNIKTAGHLFCGLVSIVRV